MRTMVAQVFKDAKGWFENFSEHRLKPVQPVVSNLSRVGGTGFGLWKPFSVCCLACVSLCILASAQTAATPPGEMSQAERESLSQALGEAGNSPVDFIHALENHIAKYPNSPKRSELERALVKSAMDLKD